MPILTANLTLRLFILDDYQSLRELESDPKVLKYRSRKTISPEMTQEFLVEAQIAHQKIPRKNFAYAIILNKNEIWLGQCGMTMISSPQSDKKRAYLWFSLLPRYWGQGYMTEAVKTLIHVGFDEFDLAIIEGECSPENIASARVLEKAGLQFKGELEREDKLGQMKKLLHYEINHCEWKLQDLNEPEITEFF